MFLLVVGSWEHSGMSCVSIVSWQLTVGNTVEGSLQEIGKVLRASDFETPYRYLETDSLCILCILWIHNLSLSELKILKTTQKRVVASVIETVFCFPNQRSSEFRMVILK
jgi:hypothetical protein